MRTIKKVMRAMVALPEPVVDKTNGLLARVAAFVQRRQLVVLPLAIMAMAASTIWRQQAGNTAFVYATVMFVWTIVFVAGGPSLFSGDDDADAASAPAPARN